jgi:hypothetical protein
MEVSEECELEPGGQELIQTVVNLTGLPELMIRCELDQILEHGGQSPKDLTLDQLRQALAAYLEEMKAEFQVDENTTVLE